MKRRNVLILSLMVLMMFVMPLCASNGTTEQGENILVIFVDFLATGLLIYASFMAWKIYSTYREGEMALPWGFLAGGVIFFMISRVIQIVQAGGYYLAPNWLETFIYLLVAISLMIGFLLIKKALS